jgi:hypothetical protein
MASASPPGFVGGGPGKFAAPGVKIKCAYLDFCLLLGYFLINYWHIGLEVNMGQEDVKARIKAAAPQGRISCATAFRLAQELGVSRKDLGELLNELKIKITQCQLGCF